MPTPEFILRLREKVGQEELWLTGVTAVVLRGEINADGVDERETLLVKRSDNGKWTPVAGILEPGEEPAVAAEREVLEEASIVAHVESLAWVHTLEPVVYQNGDVSRYLELVFRCSWVSGDPTPGDDEATEAGWFRLSELPALELADHVDRIAVAAAGEAAARFERS